MVDDEIPWDEWDLQRIKNKSEVVQDYLYSVENGEAVDIFLEVPCRKCDKCGEFRKKQWVARAITEHQRSSRTWFCTFTYRSSERQRITAQAYRRCKSTTLRHLSVEVQEDVTKFLKRVRMRVQRKTRGAKLRYLLPPPEPHADDFPHVHMLLHEMDEGTITWRDIARDWRENHGNLEVVLVEEAAKAAGYVAKYVTKDLNGRVRASIRYGQSETRD